MFGSGELWGCVPAWVKEGEMLWELETSWENQLQSREDIAVGKPNRKGGSVGLLGQDLLRRSMEGGKEVSPGWIISGGA